MSENKSTDGLTATTFKFSEKQSADLDWIAWAEARGNRTEAVRQLISERAALLRKERPDLAQVYQGLNPEAVNAQ